MSRKMCVPGIIVIMAAFLQCLWTSSAYAGGWKIENLQKAINDRGHHWKAGKTSVSDFSPEAFKSLLTYRFPENVQMMDRRVSLLAPFAASVSLDWRNHNGGNWISPIKNQQSCGSCYSFATSGTLETLIKFSQNNPDFSIDLAEQYIVSCGPSGTQGSYAYGGCYGNYTDLVADFLVSTGVPDEACFPYASSQQSGTEPPCYNACADAAARSYKLSGYSFIAGEAGYIPYPDYIKAVLVNKPVPCGMLAYQDFAYYTGGIYEPVPQTDEQGGGHLVYIIGYDDSQQCWIVKNSWGTDWGETASYTPYTPGGGDGGYFRISYVTAANSLTQFGTDAADLSFEGSAITTTISPFTTTVFSSTTTTAGGSCPPPGEPDYTVDCGNSMCCPYFYPICCDDGYCYTYQEYCPSSGITTTTVSFGCPVDYPVDCYNGWCCPADYPYCGTGLRTGMCYTGPPGPCAAEVALDYDETRLAILRTFRDEVLSKTPEGQSLIKLYYEWSPAMARMIEQDEGYKQEIKGIIDGIVPMIEKQSGGAVHSD
jgi:C1A family cysteine protease